MRGYNRKKLSARCLIKVDLQKAFDSLSWDFLLNVLKAMKFLDPFIGWIKGYVTSPKFSICINRGLCGYFFWS